MIKKIYRNISRIAKWYKFMQMMGDAHQAEVKL